MDTLSAEQRAGIEKIRAWHASGPFEPFRLAGPAGTGKTTMAKAVGPALGLRSVHFGAYTGKAAHVLRSKGATPAGTIHSAVYYPVSDQEAKQKLWDARAELEELKAHFLAIPDEDTALTEEADLAIQAKEAEIRALKADTQRMAWEWNPDSPWATADLIILDEVSMVGPKIAADIEMYGVPVLVLGDPAQLPPVEGGGHYLNGNPDHLLTEIHRQALESPVLELATRIRLSTRRDLGMTPDDFSPARLGEAIEADQVLCWSNHRRWALIDAMRTKQGRPRGRVVAGDRIMCLTNNRSMAVFNGQQFQVLEVEGDGILGPTLLLRDDDGHERSLAVFADGFAGREMQETAKRSGSGAKGQRMLATFADAITVHKAQGSEWPNVYVANELPRMMAATARHEGAAAALKQARQWAYTAVSRASESVTVTAAR